MLTLLLPGQKRIESRLSVKSVIAAVTVAVVPLLLMERQTLIRTGGDAEAIWNHFLSLLNVSLSGLVTEAVSVFFPVGRSCIVYFPLQRR